MNEKSSTTDALKIARDLNKEFADARTSAVSTAIKCLQKAHKAVQELDDAVAAYTDAYIAAQKSWAKNELDQMKLPSPDRIGRPQSAGIPSAKPTRKRNESAEGG